MQVVNAHGNLNGTHPDPLDEDLHALITADNLVRVQPSQHQTAVLRCAVLY